MVTISDCTSCNKEFPAEDLCPKGRCVDCYDRSCGPYRSPEQRKKSKKRWKANNRDKIRELQQGYYTRRKERASLLGEACEALRAPHRGGK